MALGAGLTWCSQALSPAGPLTCGLPGAHLRCTPGVQEPLPLSRGSAETDGVGQTQFASRCGAALPGADH